MVISGYEQECKQNKEEITKISGRARTSPVGGQRGIFANQQLGLNYCVKYNSFNPVWKDLFLAKSCHEFAERINKTPVLYVRRSKGRGRKKKKKTNSGDLNGVRLGQAPIQGFGSPLEMVFL